MPLVKHGQINDHPSQNPTLKQPQQQPADDQPGIGLDKPYGQAHHAPGCDEGREVDARAELFEEEVGGDVDEDIGDVKDQEGEVELGADAGDAEVFGEAGEAGVAYVGAVDEGEEPGVVRL